MSEEKLLLSRITASPADETLRLAYADWCEGYGTRRVCNFCEGKGVTLGAGPDRGNPACGHCVGGWVYDALSARAAFIRAQFELEGEEFVPILEEVRTEGSGQGRAPVHVVRGHECTPRATELMGLCVAMFTQFGNDWFGELLRDFSVAVTVHRDPALVVNVFRERRVTAFVLAVRRGFPEVLRCGTSDFVGTGYAQWLVDRAPLRGVQLIDLEPRNVRRRSGGRRCYSWFRPIPGLADDPGRQVRLRNAIIDFRLCPADGRHRWNFSSEAEAWNWLSDRCLEYARRTPAPVSG